MLPREVDNGNPYTPDLHILNRDEEIVVRPHPRRTLRHSPSTIPAGRDTHVLEGRGL